MKMIRNSIHLYPTHSTHLAMKIGMINANFSKENQHTPAYVRESVCAYDHFVHGKDDNRIVKRLKFK